MSTRFLPIALAMAISCAAATSASALSCDPFEARGVSGSSGCFTSVDLTGSARHTDSAAAMSGAAVFGVSNWSEIGRTDDLWFGIKATGFKGLGVPWGGKLFVGSESWSSFDTLSLVMKTGGRNGGSWLAYELAEQGPGGSLHFYASTFKKGHGRKGVRKISEVALYGGGLLDGGPVDGQPLPVPAPASSWMLLGVMGVAGVTAWRRRRAVPKA